ncbi:TIGR02269 family lipoprotein, partial [Verrucomicrobium spinosum]|uniref:TIGR02269 family lipoprotein n=2 Tax=Verrucomicrobium spinosum TaxID=2736 RepID=UPI001C4847FE
RIVDKRIHDSWHNGKDIARGGCFNQVWRDFFRQFPEATESQIRSKLDEIRSGTGYTFVTKDGSTRTFNFATP